MIAESTQHKRIKEIIGSKLKEWTGATLQEYPSSGYEFDVFAVTPAGVSIYVEIIWSSSRANFFRDLLMITTSDANVKIVIVSPDIIENADFQRRFEKVAISQRRINFAMHGSLINGEKVITDVKYVNTEFKNIVLGLVNQVSTRGKVLGPQANLEPPKPNSAVEVTEQLLSNLFPVRKHPATIFSSPTALTSRREVCQRLGNSIRGIPFLPKNRNLYTFDNLRDVSSPFAAIIRSDNVAEEKISSWLQDNLKRNDIVDLFNSGLRMYCENRGMYFDAKHHRFICLLKDGKTNYFCWKRELRPTYREIAACIKGKDGTVLYCKHYAADLSFILLDNSIFLKIEPTMVFSYDGHRPIRSSKLADLMSRYLSKQYNTSYLDLVRFWGKFLSRLDKTITIQMGKEKIEIDSTPIGVTTNFGIKNKEVNFN